MNDLYMTDEDLNITEFDVDNAIDFLPTFDELSEVYDKLYGKDVDVNGKKEEI